MLDMIYVSLNKSVQLFSLYCKKW